LGALAKPEHVARGGDPVMMWLGWFCLGAVTGFVWGHLLGGG
jgi:hypothetical protein